MKHFLNLPHNLHKEQSKKREKEQNKKNQRQNTVD